MKQMEIFEQAMCCPTGLCGPSIDPELLRLSSVLDALKEKGIVVGRYNLSNDPLKFVQTKVVTDFLQSHGPEELPLVLVDGAFNFPAVIRRTMNLQIFSALTQPSCKTLLKPGVMQRMIRHRAAAETALTTLRAAVTIQAPLLPRLAAAVMTARAAKEAP